MGNGISFNTDTPSGYAGLVGSLRLAAMISSELTLLLRDTSNLRNSPFMSYVGSINGSGSDTIRVRQAGLDGRDVFETVSGEADAATTQSLATSTVDVVVARLVLMYKETDLASLSGYGNADIDPFRMAMSMAGSYDATFAAKTATAAQSFSTSVGSNATQFSVDDFFNGIFALEKADTNRGALAPYAAVLHPVALTELQDSLRNETGNAVSWAPASQEMLKAKGPGYTGDLLGVSTYRSSHVASNGSGGYDNYIFGIGGLGFADGTPNNLPGAGAQIQVGSAVIVEIERDGERAVSKIIGHSYLGVAAIDVTRGALMLSTT